MERRQDARFTVQFRSSFSSANIVSGQGTLSDLSIRGCRVVSPIQVKPGTVLQLQVHDSDDDPPIQVSQAIIRWCRAGSFGCEFVSLSPDEWARLQHVVKDLDMQPFQRERQNSDVV